MATHACLVAILLGASLGSAADAPPPKDQEVLLSAGQALVGVDRLCIVPAILAAEQDARFIDAPKLKSEIVERLSGVGIKHVEREADLVPRLIIRIEGIPMPDSDKLVCRVQVSLIRYVLLFNQPSLPIPAEVWQGRPALAAVARVSMAETISSAVAGQIDRFIDSYQGAASLSALPSGVKPDRAAPTASGYPFLSSKSSQVFHRPDCRWAQNIASDNRVGYKSREEAVQAGRRPCKTCKP